MVKKCGSLGLEKQICGFLDKYLDNAVVPQRGAPIKKNVGKKLILSAVIVSPEEVFIVVT